MMVIPNDVLPILCGYFHVDVKSFAICILFCTVCCW